MIFADILAVFQNAVEAVGREWLAVFRFQPPPVEVLHDGADDFTVGISLKYLPYYRSRNRVEDKLLLVAQQIAERDAAAVIPAL